MKRLQTFFIAAMLVAALFAVTVFFSLVGSILIKAWMHHDTTFSIYLPLIPLSLVFWSGGGFALLAALTFGLYTTFLYRKDRLFTEAMAGGLEHGALCFLLAALCFFLLALYLAINVQLAALFLLFFLPAVLIAASALFFFLLADVVEAGWRLREEHDLTI